MDKLKLLMQLKYLYDNNTNIIKYLKTNDKRNYNTVEDIMISYDFQAGSYVKAYKENPEKKGRFTERLSKYVKDEILCKTGGGRVLEAGIGEGTTLLPLLNKIENGFDEVYGFDISWSRINVARKFMKENHIPNARLFVADLFHIPVVDSSMDLVYTCHAIEPNGGKEKEILQELYRVTSRYLILMEPAYEFANATARKRMQDNGYVTNLYQTAIDLGYNVEEYSLYGTNANELNPTGFMVIKKENKKPAGNDVFCCPVTNEPMNKNKDAFFCEKSLLAYPVIGEIPCLTKSNAILASKFLD